MFEHWNICLSGENSIFLNFYESELIKPQELDGIPEYVEFNIQLDGEKFSFTLHVRQCEELIRKLKKFTDLYSIHLEFFAKKCREEKK